MISEERRVLSAFLSPEWKRGRREEGRKEERGACCRQIGVPLATRLLRRRNLFRAKTNISADMWYRLTTAQIEFSSHPSIPDEDQGAHFVSNRDRIAAFSKGPDFSHRVSSRRSLHDIYMSHDIFSHESARSRKKKLLRMYVKKKNPLVSRRKKIPLSSG